MLIVNEVWESLLQKLKKYANNWHLILKVEKVIKYRNAKLCQQILISIYL